MATLKTRLLVFFQNKPVRSRLSLILLGALAGIAHLQLDIEPSPEASSVWLVLLFMFSTLIYTFMLTLYRILQRILKRTLQTERSVLDFDERDLVRLAGFYGLVTFGLTERIVLLAFADAQSGFGKLMILQGLAISLSAWLSQRIKK